jgi:hypothetical protein
MRPLLLALACLVFCVGARFAAAQANVRTTAYRQQYPLIDTTDLGGMSTSITTTSPSSNELQMIVEAGFHFVRVDMTWQSIEQEEGAYEWSTYDSLMQQLSNYGLRPIFTLDYSNTLYSDTGAPNTPAARTGFANWAAAAVARYEHQGVVWEIYNEPNLAEWWPNPNANDYVALVDAVVPAMRAVSPDEWIVGLATSPPVDGPSCNYIQQCMEDGLLSQVDAISIHPYCQTSPEGEIPYWNFLNTLEIEYSPGNAIPIISTECGWSLEWPGITEDLQADYLVRHLMINLAYGIGLSNIFSFEDLGDDSSNYQDWFGLMTDDGSTVRPSYYFVQSVAQSLQGYTFAKRLDLGNPDDYCLLFYQGSSVKLVAWTADSTHTATLPSSACTFQVMGLNQSGTISATAAGLTFSLSGEPVVLSSEGSDSLLLVASQWAKLPSTISVANESDAINQLQSIVASPAWEDAPFGTTLSVSDVPSSSAMFYRQSFSMNLGSVATLVPGSLTVLAMFNSLPLLQDELNAPTTLSFTLTLPDGSSVTQSTQVTRTQPIGVDVTTPQSWALTVRVTNPTGLPYSGFVTAQSGLISATRPVAFSSGQTTQMLYFPSLPSALIERSVQVSVYDNSGNEPEATSPVIQTNPISVNRYPNFVPSAGWSLSLEGSPSISGTASASYSTVPASDGTYLTGGDEININYSFGPGWKYLMLKNPPGLASAKFTSPLIGVGAWIKGDGSQNGLRAIFIDSTGQCFQYTYGTITWTGWQWIDIPCTTPSDYWGGADDGVVHGALTCLTPILIDSNNAGTSGTISIFGLTYISSAP